MAVFDPHRRRTARGEERQQALLRAAAVVFARDGYHDTTTNSIAAEAGVSPATLYQFFPNKDALASALAEIYAREMREAELALDPGHALSFTAAVTKLLDLCLAFNRRRPEFHTLVLDAPLSIEARREKEALGAAFIHFIATRLQRARPALSLPEAAWHAQVAFLIFRGILDEFSRVPAARRPRLRRALHEAVLRYLDPVAGTASAG